MFTRVIGAILLVLGNLLLCVGALRAQKVAAAEKEEKNLWQPYYISPRSGQQHISLDGQWELGYRDTPVESLSGLTPEQKWIHAQVPSSVQWALYRAGELPHPYYHLNSRKYAWVPDKVWYYRRTFLVPSSAADQYVFLCFDGAGYYSKLWLNGTLLGRHEGMFGGPEVEVSKYLRPGGSNELIVEVKAGSYGVENWQPNHAGTGRVILPWGIAGGHPDVTFPSGIGPKELLPFGIWQSVRLEIVPHVHLERPFLVTKDVNANEAHLALTTEVLVNKNSLEFHLHPWHDHILNNFRDTSSSRLAESPLELRVQFKEKDGDRPVLDQRFPLHMYEGRNWVQEQIQVPSPRLWWPNGMGEPHLYRVKLTLMGQGEQLDSLEFDFGIRTIRTIPSAGPRTEDRWANWQFVVNGRPLFIKGVNWAWPMDVLLNLPHERYAWQLKAARAAGVQMMRVWGGGNPETEDFFSFCNELGIMVWEDFPIANTETPGWPQDVWEAQVLQIIFRLRNQPSLAVWSGGNEFNPYSFGNATSIGVLERSVADFDGTRLFTRTTPDPGDLHPYPDMDPTWYSQVYRLVPFVTETGMMDLAEPEALREVIDPRELEAPLRGIFSPEFTASHPEFVHHFLQYQFTSVVKALWNRSSQVDDISAPTMERLVDASRLAAGEFNQIACDLLQANYPVTTGVMPWSFTIPWPIMFPAWMDAFDQATAMYYFMKHSYEPTHLVVNLPQLIWATGERVPISISIVHAPLSAPKGLTVLVQILNDQFDSVWRQARTVAVKPGPSVTNLELGEFTTPQQLEDKFFFVVAELKQADGKLVSRSVYWPRCLKLAADPEFHKKYRESPQPSLQFGHGPWLRPQVAAMHTSLDLHVISNQIIGENQSRLKVRIRNTGAKPAFFTQFDIQGTQRAFYGTDNFFWLAPGEERMLEFDVIWRASATRNKAVFTVRAWNAEDKVGIPLADSVGPAVHEGSREQ
jgi:beta-mannosidase